MAKKKTMKKTRAKTGRKSKTTLMKRSTITLAEMAEQIMAKSRKIKEKYPKESENIATCEEDIRKQILKIKKQLNKLSTVDTELVTILTINRIEKMAEDILGGKWRL